MATSNVAFIDQNLQNFYEGTGTGYAGESTIASESQLDAFRQGGTTADDATAAIISALERRLATFEATIIEDSAALGDEDYPFDRVALKREFLDEVLAALIRADYGRSLSGSYVYNSGNNTYTAVSGSGAVFGSDAVLPSSLASYFTRSSLQTVSYTWTVSQALSNFDSTKSSLNTHPSQFVSVSPSNVDIFGGERTYTYSYYTYTALPSVTVDDNFSNLYSYDSTTGTETDNRTDILSTAGAAIYNHYSSLIDQIFAAGDAIKNDPIDATAVVTTVSGVVIGGVTYTQLVKIGDKLYVYDEATGSPRFEVEKVLTNNTAGQPVDFDFNFTADSGLVSTTYYEVDSTMNLTGSSVTGQFYHLSPMEYLYYWNEVRIRVLKGQLAYKQAVVSEIQEDLRQANAALADLEKQAGMTRAQSSDGKTVNPDSSEETQLLDLHEAMTSTTSSQLFNSAGSDDTHNYVEWEENRTRLKNYIDRRSADAQNATLDYQQVLNRFNNAYEVMAKLQEKLDNLLKGQLRNLA